MNPLTAGAYIYIWRKVSRLSVLEGQKRSFRIFFICILQYLAIQSFNQLADAIENIRPSETAWRVWATTKVLVNLSSLVEYIGLSQLVKLSLMKEQHTKG